MKNDNNDHRTSELRRARRSILAALAQVDALLARSLEGKRRWTTKPTGVGWDDLNAGERAVIAYLCSRKTDAPLDDIAGHLVAHAVAPRAKSMSWARNNVRRPLREGMVKRTAPGLFAITAKGRKERI